MTLTPPLGTMPVLQFCTPAQLMVDPAYQRPTDGAPSRTLINRMTRGWDWGLFQPLVVSRRADGGLYVVDGQHRLEAARQRGDIPQLPCVITSYDDARGEAGAFVALNQERRPLTRFNLHRAALAAGNDTAVTIQRLVEGAGLRLTGNNNRAVWKPGWINIVAELEGSLRIHGERVTRQSLEALAGGFRDQVLRQGSLLWRAIVPLVAAEPTLSIALLTDILAGATQDEWLAAFRQRAAESDTSLAIAARAAIEAAWREAMAE